MHEQPTTESTDSETDSDALDQSESNNKFPTAKLGIALILLSGIFFFTMLAVPWLPLTAAAKAMVAGGLFIGVQISWWIGAALAGQEVIKKVMFWKKN